MLSVSPKVGRTVWLDLNEGAADEYGAIKGVRYEVIEHDGTWPSIIGQVTAAKEAAEKAVANGDKPLALVVDSMTAEWDLLKTWAESRAKLTDFNKKKLRENPNAEIDVSMNFWNDANSRHRKLMLLLMTFPGIVVMTARGKDVAALDKNGRPVPNTKEYKVEGNKNLAFDASCWIRMFRDKPAIMVGARSVNVGVRPGKDDPLNLDPDWSLEGVIFNLLKCDPSNTHVRDLAEMQAQRTPEQIRDEALETTTAFDRIRELHAEARELQYQGITLENENGDEEQLLGLLFRVGEERKPKPADAQRKLASVPAEASGRAS